MKPSRLLTVLPLAWLAAVASAQSPTNITDGELELLPPYCKDVQGIRYGNASHRPSPRAAHWVGLMGDGFWALHHYCWARINMRRIYAPGTDPRFRIGALTAVVGDLNYVVLNTKPDFVLLPEIYSTLAEVELLRKSPAAAYDHIQSALKHKASYAPPYRIWGDYLMSIGKKADAKAFVQTGLEYNPTVPALRELYKQLGGDPSTIVPQAPVLEQPTSEGAAAAASAPPAEAASAGSAAPAATR